MWDFLVERTLDLKQSFVTNEAVRGAGEPHVVGVCPQAGRFHEVAGLGLVGVDAVLFVCGSPARGVVAFKLRPTHEAVVRLTARAELRETENTSKIAGGKLPGACRVPCCRALLEMAHSFMDRFEGNLIP